MRLRRLLLLGMLGAGLVAVLRMLRQRPGAHVDLYLQDGTLTSLPEDDPNGARLLALARDVLRA